MGKISHERHIHIRYSPALMAWWDLQYDYFKDYADSAVKRKGYTGINLFFFFVRVYIIWYHTQKKIEAWRRKE